jgi:hypothetical protein
MKIQHAKKYGNTFFFFFFVVFCVLVVNNNTNVIYLFARHFTYALSFLFFSFFLSCMI